ncbi:MAG TPA: hypothetical protein VK131_04420 [Candidatus Acidoferrales bacterium]|nr:hypothetical protein [Candidatus Acidoferrales bacterium]
MALTRTSVTEARAAVEPPLWSLQAKLGSWVTGDELGCPLGLTPAWAVGVAGEEPEAALEGLAGAPLEGPLQALAPSSNRSERARPGRMAAE